MKKALLTFVFLIVSVSSANAQTISATSPSYLDLQNRVVTLERQIAALQVALKSLGAKDVLPPVTYSFAKISGTSLATSISPTAIPQSDMLAGRDIYITVSGQKINNTGNSRAAITLYADDPSQQNTSCIVSRSGPQNCVASELAYYGMNSVTFKLPHYPTAPAQIHVGVVDQFGIAAGTIPVN